MKTELAGIITFAILLTGCLVFPATKAQAQGSDNFQVRYITKDSSAFDYWPCFSPDGKTIIFSRSSDGSKTWDLLSVSSEGGEVKRFSKTKLPISITRANWSYTNNIIAFTGISK